MPEGAEVKRWTEGLNKSLTGKVIASARPIGGRYMRVDPATLGMNKLQGVRINAVTCKGKLIVFELEGDDAILSTLGMTGWWEPDYFMDPAFDKYKRIELLFTDGSRAVFFDPRNFGTFKVVTTKEVKRKKAELGVDIFSSAELDEVLNFPEFEARAKRFGKSQTVAEATLDQRIACGCGNYIRADAMHLMGISPHRLLSSLSQSELRALFVSMRIIAIASYVSDGSYDTVIYGREVSPKGNEIAAFLDKNGRNVWWCPAEQA